MRNKLQWMGLALSFLATGALGGIICLTACRGLMRGRERSQPKRRSGASRKNDRRRLQLNGTEHRNYGRKIEIGV